MSRIRNGEGRTSESHAAEAYAVGRAAQANPGYNPFLEEDNDVLPKVPEIPGYATLWVRHGLAGTPDAMNIMRHTGGRMPYEYVRPSEVPELATLAERSPMYSQEEGVIRVNDVVLMKTLKATKDLYMAAVHERANRLGDGLRESVQAQRNARYKMGMKILEDREGFGANSDVE